MKHISKVISLMLALVMVLSMSTIAFAKDVDAGDGEGIITISNAAKGETYKIYKLFDATLSTAGGESIAYKGTVPAGLTDYFEADTNGYITTKEAAWDAEDDTKMSAGLQTALTSWVSTATAAAEAEADGTELKFTQVPYGYYVVTTSQGNQAISVDSINPTATIVDKNQTAPSGLTKSVSTDDVSIGDTVTYTVTFATSNYSGSGADAKKIKSYTIADDLPDFLTDVNVESIVVDNDPNVTTDETVSITETVDGEEQAPQFSGSSNEIQLTWYDDTNEKFLYDNGASITITYTAKVTDSAAIAGAGNTNTVTLTWDVEDSTNTDSLTDTATIYTYAIALKKVNEKGTALADAEFQFPFYVKEKEASDTSNVYTYAGTAEGTGLTNKITTPDSGVIIVKGVKSGTYSVTETKAPNGYTMLADSFSITAEKTTATTTSITKYLNADGEIIDERVESTDIEVTLTDDNIAASAVFVVNKAGTELPATGGMGTTAFYIFGMLMVVGAASLLVPKKRVSI